jgi:serine/threonine-protein kinase/endoribonuclease IRE1
VALYRVVTNDQGESAVVELTGGAKTVKKRQTAAKSNQIGVHIMNFENQVFAVPEASFVSPHRVEGSFETGGLSTAVTETFKNLKTYYRIENGAGGAGGRVDAPLLLESALHNTNNEQQQQQLEQALIQQQQKQRNLIVFSLLVGVLVIAASWWILRRTPVKKPQKKLEISEKILGYGSCGTVVYEGRLEGRKIAVKRMLKDFYSLAERESLILLQGGDSHPNVVSYFLKEEDEKFVYLALSYCSLTFGDLFDKTEETSQILLQREEVSEEVQQARDVALRDPISLLRQLADGLAYLHSLKVVHRDLKPQNVLIDEAGTVKISDMGLAKKMEMLTSFSGTSQASGTVGYQSPEVLLQKKQSSKMDVWGYGCVAYFVLSQGFHPFGKRINREANVVNNRMNLSKIYHPVPFHLLETCLKFDPAERCDMQQVCAHPFFWDKLKQLHFLIDVSDLLESLEGNVEATKEFEERHKAVLGTLKWQKVLNNPQLAGDMGKYRKYQNTLKDLLRLIRNKAHHYRDLSPGLQERLGSYPDGYFDYWAHLFPNLFMQCFLFIQTSKNNYKTQSNFERYFPQ